MPQAKSDSNTFPKYKADDPVHGVAFQIALLALRRLKAKERKQVLRDLLEHAQQVMEISQQGGTLNGQPIRLLPQVMRANEGLLAALPRVCLFMDWKCPGAYRPE